ncbi:lipopolysaccharide biosynthesis protein [Weissella cibaria]|uniref:lipopolysaccharide biosynthesis protein n=1 Tax=Weissella cibaria TaxID=137591 RepID=UPI0021D5357B|nr:lipopolysaccharide biosynthesis protein [Weissella cibaria]MCU7537881.1 lipopolysaccharide biosynthesis protein [Weissella cibaria]
MAERARELIRNTGVFAIGSLSTKLLSLLMVPLYTTVLSTADYGTVDVIGTFTGLLAPLVTLSVYDAVFRWALDDANDAGTAFSNALVVWASSMLIFSSICVGLAALGVAHIGYFWFMVVLGSLGAICSSLVRGLGYVKLFTVAGIVSSVVFMTLNLVFLLQLELGLTGYLLASAISAAVSLLVVAMGARVWQYWHATVVQPARMQQLLIYSLPLVPNALSWWGIASANRVVLLTFAVVAANGLYAVANKLPSLINLVYGAFLQSWQMAAVKSYDDQDAGAYYTKTFDIVARLQLLMVMALLCVTQFVFATWIAPAYWQAWQAVPGLLLTVVYTNMSAMVEATYLAAKRTRGLFLTTVYGAVISIGLSVVSVPFLGIIGASLASCVGFAAVLGIRLYETRRFVGIRVTWSAMLKYHLVIGLQIGLMCLLPVGWMQGVCLSLLMMGLIWSDWPYYQRLFVTLTNKR